MKKKQYILITVLAAVVLLGGALIAGRVINPSGSARDMAENDRSSSTDKTAQKPGKEPESLDDTKKKAETGLKVDENPTEAEGAEEFDVSKEDGRPEDLKQSMTSDASNKSDSPDTLLTPDISNTPAAPKDQDEPQQPEKPSESSPTEEQWGKLNL